MGREWLFERVEGWGGDGLVRWGVGRAKIPFPSECGRRRRAPGVRVVLYLGGARKEGLGGLRIASHRIIYRNHITFIILHPRCRRAHVLFNSRRRPWSSSVGTGREDRARAWCAPCCMTNCTSSVASQLPSNPPNPLGAPSDSRSLPPLPPGRRSASSTTSYPQRPVS